MKSLLRRNDWIRTGAAVPAVILRLGLVAVVAVAAALLIPVLGWQIAAVAAVVLGVVLPQTFGGWMAIACLAVGMVMHEPSIWRALVAVLVVHIIHVVSSLMLVIPWRGRVVLAALRPTLRRLLLVQLVAQPLTLLVMLIFLSGRTSSGGITVEGAAIAGAVALAALAVLFLMRVKRV
ncbi:hypothetical protein [Microbacterium murale]|uniref:Uncharacterized protein n=1 Tax=Microbacterium murale TaxID=1081040 RepID=A0ABQ1S052_9MICO|nr:hypothetical protein [Microbacterium murale]GGD85175.1 hypothetical protein GCM10007269_30110 [Microbacterium murale]